MGEGHTAQRCEYTWEENYDDNVANNQSCCWRRTVDTEGIDRCWWHADPEETNKTVTNLKNNRVKSDRRSDNKPYELLDGAKLNGIELQDAICFRNIALRDADFRNTNLSEADFRQTDLRNADFRQADLTDANFRQANLRDADFSHEFVDGTFAGWDEESVLKEYGLSLFDRPFSGADLSSANLTDACLVEADLRSATLHDAVLTGANIESGRLNHPPVIIGPRTQVGFCKTDITDANCKEVQLKNAQLDGADFSDTNLRGADLSEQNLAGPILNGTDMTRADLSGANLSDADLRNVNLAKTAIDHIKIANPNEVQVNSDTTVGMLLPLRTGFRHRPINTQSNLWEHRARGYEKLRKVFQEKGMDDHHKKLYSYQRRARAKEALRRKHPFQWLGSYLSRVLTGHGVMISRVFLWSLIFVLFPALWYSTQVQQPIEGDSVYYSVVTFVTAPPHPISGVQGEIQLIDISKQNITEFIVLLQTYVGTALTVLLGYVLSNRDII